MKKTVKQYLPIGALIVGSILLLSLLSYIGFKSENVQQTTNEKSTKMQYVLVNEDKGATFEGKKYSLGTDFVTLINQDNQNRWETTTRDIATRGIQEGQFDAQIIIPQDFSERLLSLQSISPEKALVEYQVREGQNEVTNQAIQTKVNDVLKDFNQRIVQMYFSSIIGNLSDAQQNVNQMVGLENTHQGTLEKDIYLPFKDIPTNFTSVSDTASILDEENKVFTKEQEAFVEAVKSLMETNNNGLEENSKSTEEVQKSVNDYADEANDKLETSIQQFNDQFELQKKQLELQWGNDLSNYKNQYDLLNTSATNQLGLFYTPGTDEETDFGVYADFLKNAKIFEKSQKQRILELETNISELEKQVDDLTKLKKNIALKYFNNPEKTPVSLSDESTEVKEAISKLFTEVNNTSEITPSGEGKSYLDSIYSNLNTLNTMAIPSSADLNTLLEILQNKYSLDSATADTIRASYNIVTVYDSKESKDDTGTSSPILTNVGASHFKLANELDTSTTEIEDKFDLTNTFTVNSKTSSQTLTFSTSRGTIGTVSIDGNSLNQIAINLQNLLNGELKSQGSTYVATASVISNQSIQITIVDDVAPGATSKAPESKNLTIPISYQVAWKLNTRDADPTEFYRTDYQWTKDGRTVLVSSPLNLYIDKDNNLKDDLPKLFELYNQLTSTAEKITTIYANPKTSSSDLTIQNFYSYISTPDNKDKSFADLATENSIYWLYNNMTPERLKTNLFRIL